MTALTAARQRVLDIIAAQPAGIGMPDLCKRLGRTRYTVEQQVRHLRHLGLTVATHPKGSRMNRWCTPATIAAGLRESGKEYREAERQRKADEWRRKVARAVESFADQPVQRRVRMSETRLPPILGPISVFHLGACA